jgi:hypothetical protein
MQLGIHINQKDFNIFIMEDSGNWFEQGVTLFENRNYPDAIIAFDKAIALNQHPLDAWFNRGLVLAEMGKFRQALQSFDETLALDPGHKNAKIARTMVLERMGITQDTNSVPHATATPQSTSPNSSLVPESVNAPGKKPVRSPFLASGLSFLFPGWGQWYNGRRLDGLFFLGAWLLLVIARFRISEIFAILSFVLILFGMYNAHTTAEKINRGKIGFTRKSRLFWLPVVVWILVFIFVIGFWVMMLGTIGTTHSIGVYATASQPNASSIIVTYLGGKNAQEVHQVDILVTDADGHKQKKTLTLPDDTGSPATGSSVTFTGSYAGDDRVEVTGKFRNGTAHEILSMYL